MINSGFVGVIAQGSPEHRHAVKEAVFGNEHVLPDRTDEFVLGDSAIRTGCQINQGVEGFRGDDDEVCHSARFGETQRRSGSDRTGNSQPLGFEGNGRIRFIGISAIQHDFKLFLRTLTGPYIILIRNRQAYVRHAGSRGWKSRDFPGIELTELLTMAKSIQYGWVVFFALLISVSPLAGQTAATGALVGTVTDSTGAVVPNVTVTATDAGTGQARTTTTGRTVPTSLACCRRDPTM